MRFFDTTHLSYLEYQVDLAHFIYIYIGYLYIIIIILNYYRSNDYIHK